MRDWSLHLLDLMENSLRAEATRLDLSLVLSQDGALDIILRDDGFGMEKDFTSTATDPFTTTRTTRKVGLGLSLAQHNAELTGGYLELLSEPGCGTRVHLCILTSHIDCLPLGDLAQTMVSLILLNHDKAEFTMDLSSPLGSEHFSTKVIKQVLGDEVALAEPEVLNYLKELLHEQSQTVFGGILL